MVERVKVEGLRELEAALRELPKATGTAVLRRVLKKRAQPIADAAKSKVRVDEGQLRDSIAVSTKLSRRQKGLHRKTEGKHTAEMFVGAGPLPQAITEEFGTVDQAAHPFMRTAWDENRRAMLDGIGKDIGDEIEKAARRLARKNARLAAKAAAGG